MSEKAKSDQIEIGALWKKDGQSQKFLSGMLKLNAIGIDKEIPIVIFSNKFKKADNHPDLRIYLSKPKTPAPAPAAKAATQAPEPESDELI